MNRIDLLNSLRDVAALVPSKSTLLAATFVLAEGTKLYVNNIEQEAQVEVGFELPTFCVNAKRFLAVLSEIDDEEVTITPTKNGITVAGGGASFQLPCIDPADFPRPDERLHTTWGCGEYATSEIVEAIRFCATARSTEESRLVMSNVAIGDGYVAATDGRRLHAYEIVTNGEKSYLPPKFADFIAKAKCEQVRVNGFGLGYTAIMDGVVVTTRSLGSGYPDWKRVFPAPSPTYVEVDAESLVSAMHRAKLVTEDGKYHVVLAVKDGVLLVTVNALDVELFRETIPCVGAFTGVIRVNPQYVIDGVIPTGKCKLHFDSEDAPLLLRSNGGKANAVVMPIRA